MAWEPLGWKPAWFSEIEPFPAAVLAHRWPDVPNLGDMTKIRGLDYRGQIDVLVGGTPCQAFSVAGLRKGLDDARGNLTLVFAKLADEINPSFVVWENVPGVLSDKTNAFGCLLGALAGEDDPLVPPGGKWTNAGFVLGPKRAIAWRVLDAQYFGVAQRRRRVFLVACPRGGADPREVLFEREGVRRDSAPSREEGEEASRNVAPCVRAGGNSTGGDRPYGMDVDTCDSLQVVPVAFGGNNQRGPIDVATACNAHGGPCGRMDFESETFCVQTVADPITSSFAKHHGATAGKDCLPRNHVCASVTHALRGEGFDASEDGTGRGTPLVPVAFAQNQLGEVRTGEVTNTLNQNSNASGRNTPMVFSAKDYGADAQTDVSPTLRAGNSNTGNQNSGNWMAVAAHMQVRRLTPRECERLQGMPGDHTDIPWRGKPAGQCPDGPRYKAIGNSMAVPCMAWIGKRIRKEAAWLR